MNAWKAASRSVLVVGAALMLSSAIDALAHALLTKSEPARRAVLSKPPAQVRLWFNEKLEPAFCTVEVLADDGKPVTRQPAHVAAQDPKLLELALPALPPGNYTVQYRVLSVDGHTVRAAYRFSVQGR